jgi:hypothetical protein
MAEIREPKGTFEAAGLTIEQVQEWLANPCTQLVIAIANGEVEEIKAGICRIAEQSSVLNDEQLGRAMRAESIELLARERFIELLKGADAYASDK